MRFSRSDTVQRLALLVARDRLLVLVAELPYSLAWVRACSDLGRLEARLQLRHEAA